MSKELIEQLRELSANRKPYATGAHGQVIGMESYRIVANGFALECIDEAADRIEELERDLLNLVCRIHRDGGHYIAKYGEAKAIADADTVAAQNNADLDALQADNARLREALETLWLGTNPNEWDGKAIELFEAALSPTPEQSLAEFKNKVIEDCAVTVENCEPDDNGRLSIQEIAEAVLAMKEQQWP